MSKKTKFTSVESVEIVSMAIVAFDKKGKMSIACYDGKGKKIESKGLKIMKTKYNDFVFNKKRSSKISKIGITKLCG